MRDNNDNIKALNLLHKLAEQYPEIEIPDPTDEDIDISEAWREAVELADQQHKARAKETGVFRVCYGVSGITYLYRLEDYEAVADHLETTGELPADLALEIEKG